MKKLTLALLIVFSLNFFNPILARADGIIIPEPPICDPGACPPFPITQLEIRYHRVVVTIENQIATTRVDQVFYNPNEWQVEGSYIFPVPVEAAISSFSLWVDGKPAAGEVLDAEQARATYEEIVRTLRDPALLEYAGTGAWKARIFPIPPRGERRVELEYTQVLTAESGLVQYTYPLSTEKFSRQPLEEASVSVRIRSQEPIRAAYSPSHNVEIIKEGDFEVRVGYEERNVLPDRDFSLYYSIGEAEAFHLLSYRDPGDRDDPDGFFLVLLAPRPEAERQAVPKDIILVLDRSGSMEGEKFTQAQEALRYILRNLNAEDRFNIITFSTGIDTYARALRPADEALEALPWVDRLSARGNTDINRALLEAADLAQAERPTYLIFLTDGLPTEGVIESEKILANFRAEAPDNLRLFTFGVGYDVDTTLLDSLAQENHGASAYVLPGERLDEQLSAFYEKISTPVLTDLALDFGAIRAYDIYPEPLPDLFVGSQIVAVGRYREGGAAIVTLQGEINNETQTFRFAEQFFARDSREENPALATLPRLWATRKIGYLLNQIRLRGPDKETIDQIVRLSIRYGIVTPYTSYLVTEDAVLGNEAQARLAEEQFSAMQEAPAAAVSGADAVRKSAEQGAMAEAESVRGPAAEAADVVKIAGSRTYVLQGGVWTDTTFDPGRMKPQEVAFLSEDYFRLLGAYPELGPAFALGSQVLAVVDGTAYRVVDADAPVQPLPALPTRTPLPGAAPAQKTPIAQAGQPTATRPALEATETNAFPPENEPPASNPPAEAPSANPLCAGLFLPMSFGALGWAQLRRRTSH
jgi:Ca-activated chloride channel homolog